jgi:uncharacterized protein
MNKLLDREKLKQYLSGCSPTSKIYIGCDSTRYKKDGVWFADYATVVVVHINGKNGCKIFGEIVTERDFMQKKGKPNMRLLNECYKVSGLYLELFEVIGDRDVELHLDINPNPKYASNEVVQQAMGYIKGTCDITPKIKPEAFCASYAADRFSEFTSMYQEATSPTV